MLNIVPQVGRLNKGVWLDSENLSRENLPCMVSCIVKYNDSSNDIFLGSHGVMTPDIFVKTVRFGGETFTWEFPNTFDIGSNLDDYRVNLKDILVLQVR
jgi:endonuclease G